MKKTDGIGPADSLPIREHVNWLFCESSYLWAEDSVFYVLSTLLDIQKKFNTILKIRGEVRLNDVYEKLGIRTSYYGEYNGWSRKRDPNCYIDFGLFDLYRSEVEDFLNGETDGRILLNFNLNAHLPERRGLSI